MNKIVHIAPKASLCKICKWVLMLIVLVLIDSPCLAQSPTYKNFEQTVVLTDRNIYLAGEQLNYAVYVFNTGNNQRSSVSQVAYIQLIDREQNTVASEAVWLNDGFTAGTIDLPKNIATKVYTLVAYTKWMLNFNGAPLGNALVEIFNPYQDIPESVQDLDAEIQAKKNDEFPAKIRLEKNEFHRREKVRAELKTNWESNIAVVVTKEGLQPTLNTTELNIVNQTDSYQLKQFTFPLENIGFSISGIAHSNLNPGKDFEIIATIPGKNSNYHRTVCNENRFRILMEKQPNNHGLILYSPKDQSAEFTVPSPFNTQFQSGSIPSLNTKIATTEFFKNLWIAAQIQEKFQLRHQTKPVSSRPFYQAADETILLKDYVRLPLVEEVFKELTKGVLIGGMGNHKKIEVIDKVTNRTLGSQPCLLINGIRIYDQQLVLDLPVDHIEKIAIVQSNYFYQGEVLQGIIDIQLKRNSINYDQLLPSYQMEYLETPANTFNTWQFKTSPKKRVPDYRNVLYFNGNLHADKHGSGEFEFTTSDEPGTYIIAVYSIAAQGIQQIGKERLEVK